MHYVGVLSLVVFDFKFGSWDEDGLGFEEAVPHDVILIHVLLLPFLMLRGSKE